MEIYINSKPVETQAENLDQLALQLELPAKGVAMAAESKMIPRTDWEKTPVTEGMHVVVIKAACGGSSFRTL